MACISDGVSSMKLPECVHRGGEVSPDQWVCRSDRLIHDGTVSGQTCQMCPYANAPSLGQEEQRIDTQLSWTKGMPCPHMIKGCCRLAAALARVPKESVRVIGHQCAQCQMQHRPTLHHPNQTVAMLANLAGDGSVARKVAAPQYDPNELPCRHRTPHATRVVKCQPCQNMGMSRLKIHGCAVHGECAIRGYAIEVQNICLTCKDRDNTQKQSVAAMKRAIAPARGLMFNRMNEPADWLGDQFAGGACVLVCGGPSVAEMDVSKLNRRGVFIAAISEVAATHVRPHAWFSVDKCTTYHEAIWRDSQIMKFVARQLFDAGNDGKTPVRRDGQWEPSTPARKFPNVWYYNRGDEWEWDGFLTRPHAMWCTTVDGKDRIKKSVMLVAIRLLHWLGFRSVYLIGCDFHMTRERQYAFPSTKGDGAFRSNNKAYRALNETFVRLRPLFEASGFRVFNATPGGRLDAFERVSLDDAIDACLASFPQEIDVAGLYH